MQPPEELELGNARTPLRPIADFQLALRPTWAKVPVAPEASDWPLDVADRLCDEGPLRAVLASRLAGAHRDLLGDEPHVMAGVWVPDRAVPEALGILTVDWLVADPTSVVSRQDYRERIARSPRRDLTVLAQLVEDIDLPAGPAVRERERVSRSSGRRFSRRETVFETLIYTVFPPESTDALQLTFSTTALDRGDAMAEDGDAMLATLNVLLGEADAAT
jgi:hypothetical protein